MKRPNTIIKLAFMTSNTHLEWIVLTALIEAFRLQHIQIGAQIATASVLRICRESRSTMRLVLF